jgi:uncharacterized protein YdhG (YjbR/CyaY superfamily)
MEAGVKFKTVDEYFATLTPNEKNILDKMRMAIKRAAPQAQEVISYNVPAIKLNGILVYYAAHKEHIGFYPTASPIEVFKNELAAYKCSKGAVQFPIGEPMPLELVGKIVRFRVGQDIEKARNKK